MARKTLKRTLAVRVSYELSQHLKHMANLRGISVGDLVRNELEQFRIRSVKEQARLEAAKGIAA